MLKKVLAFSLAGASLTLLPLGDVQAHLVGYKNIGGVWKHISSYDCTMVVTQVANLEQHPAKVECDALVTSFDYLCQNPNDKLTGPEGMVRGNSGPHMVEFSATEVVDSESLTKKVKGKASKTILMPDATLDAADDLCSVQNKLWTAADELILSVTVRLKSFSCVDDACTQLEQANEQLVDCFLPHGYDIVDNPPPGGGTPTPYDCFLIAEAHCDKGETCPIPQ